VFKWFVLQGSTFSDKVYFGQKQGQKAEWLIAFVLVIFLIKTNNYARKNSVRIISFWNVFSLWLKYLKGFNDSIYDLKSSEDQKT
jgi:hypothetical protein